METRHTTEALSISRINQLQVENKRLRAALMVIVMPEGIYSRDKLEYANNVIEWCIQTAKDALAEGDADADPA